LEGFWFIIVSKVIYTNFFGKSYCVLYLKQLLEIFWRHCVCTSPFLACLCC